MTTGRAAAKLSRSIKILQVLAASTENETAETLQTCFEGGATGYRAQSHVDPTILVYPSRDVAATAPTRVRFGNFSMKRAETTTTTANTSVTF
jgi:hypothetical protein